MTAQSVCAVIVTYNPQPTFIDNIVAVAAQVGHVVLVDNGSSGETQRHLQELETRLGCKVIRNHQNLGIAAALNLGVNHAIRAGFDWVAAFDQDSCVSDGFISQMLETYQRAAHPEKVAIIAPTCVDRESRIRIRMLRSSNGKVLLAMTSGSMMPLSAIRDVGGFDESLFMDYVDVEFCLRVRQRGMLILQSPAVLFHALGRTTFHNFLGLAFGVTNHSAGRRYYITRNRLLLLRRYAADWPWTWRESRSMLFDAAKIVLMEDNKWQKCRAMAMGTTDALRGKVGKQIEL
ncbi:MAG: glycosyltransferase family 2 protein [Acidobacteriia bacterium]|nr:glycosyltransferase family 2 protein [Terriglobia bacterium]